MCKASQKSGSNYNFKAKLSDFSKLQQLRITYKDLEASTYSVFLLASINPSHSITWCRRFFPKLNRSEYHLTLSSDKAWFIWICNYCTFYCIFFIKRTSVSILLNVCSRKLKEQVGRLIPTKKNLGTIQNGSLFKKSFHMHLSWV